jgi:hypothetical protein
MGGKTTLTKLLGDVFSLPTLTYSRPTAAAKKLGYARASDVPEEHMASFQWLALIEQIAAEKALWEEFEGYISDRSVIDYLAYFVEQTKNNISVTNSKAYFDCVQSHVPTYDLIIIVPPLSEQPFDNGMRHVTNPDVVHQNLLKSFNELDVQNKVLVLTTQTPYDRVEEVLTFLETDKHNVKRARERFNQLRESACQTS